MHSSTFPASPLAIIHTTIVGSALASAMPLLAHVFAPSDPVWSRAAFFRSDPSRPRTGLAARSASLLTAPDGSTPAALEAALAAPHEPGPDPGGRGPARSLRD